MVGRKKLEAFSGQYALCHRGGDRWRDAVDADVVPLALNGERLHQADQRHLGGAVIGLAEGVKGRTRKGAAT